MRPRVFPAEDQGRAETVASLLAASMRPRVFPAEDSSHTEDNSAMQALQ